MSSNRFHRHRQSAILPRPNNDMSPYAGGIPSETNKWMAKQEISLKLRQRMMERNVRKDSINVAKTHDEVKNGLQQKVLRRLSRSRSFDENALRYNDNQFLDQPTYLMPFMDGNQQNMILMNTMQTINEGMSSFNPNNFAFGLPNHQLINQPVIPLQNHQQIDHYSFPGQHSNSNLPTSFTEAFGWQSPTRGVGFLHSPDKMDGAIAEFTSLGSPVSPTRYSGMPTDSYFMANPEIKLSETKPTEQLLSGGDLLLQKDPRARTSSI